MDVISCDASPKRENLSLGDIPAVLEAADDGANEATLDAIRLDGNEATQESVSQPMGTTQALGWQLAKPENSRLLGSHFEFWVGNRDGFLCGWWDDWSGIVVRRPGEKEETENQQQASNEKKVRDEGSSVPSTALPRHLARMCLIGFFVSAGPAHSVVLLLLCFCFCFSFSLRLRC